MSEEKLKLFYGILEAKNSWGKNEIKKNIARGYRGYTNIYLIHKVN